MSGAYSRRSCGAGQTGGFNHGSDAEQPFTARDEPATLPRVEDLIIITESSPWCTIVHNSAGVTLGDVCTTLWKEWVFISSGGSDMVSFMWLTYFDISYSENAVTEKEFESLGPRMQDQIRRFASGGAANGWSSFYSPQTPAPGNRFRRTGMITHLPKLFSSVWLTSHDHFRLAPGASFLQQADENRFILQATPWICRTEHLHHATSCVLGAFTCFFVLDSPSFTIWSPEYLSALSITALYQLSPISLLCSWPFGSDHVAGTLVVHTYISTLRDMSSFSFSVMQVSQCICGQDLNNAGYMLC